jgi:hypothetical protein
MYMEKKVKVRYKKKRKRKIYEQSCVSSAYWKRVNGVSQRVVAVLEFFYLKKYIWILLQYVSTASKRIGVSVYNGYDSEAILKYRCFRAHLRTINSGDYSSTNEDLIEVGTKFYID